MVTIRTKNEPEVDKEVSQKEADDLRDMGLLVEDKPSKAKAEDK